MQTVTLSPVASILIESMRDIGYSLETALADIVDNSITAGATTIKIFVDTTAEFPRLAVLDNGAGMSREELLSAMRLGSTSPLAVREGGDLGRFGLGLKTASFSQCRHLTVVSRQGSVTSAAVWDLDFVASRNEWAVQVPEVPETIPWIEELGETGTLVVWSTLDRLLEGEDSKSHLNARIAQARRHLELVFHRFLKGEARRPKIEIFLNGQPLVPWDPFPRHPAAQFDPVEKIKLGGHLIEFQAVTLPHHNKVSRDDWEKYGGEAGYLKNQGFYIYREGRLIIHGTWFGIIRQSELTKLSRVRVDMPNGLDAEWKVDVKKSSAQLPRLVRSHLRRVIERIAQGSKRTYQRRGRRLVDSQSYPLWYRRQGNTGISYCVNTDHPAFAEFTSELTPDLEARFRALIQGLASALPLDALFADIGSHAGEVTGGLLDRRALRVLALPIVRMLLTEGMEPDDALQLMQNVKPFDMQWEDAAVVIQNILEEDRDD